jgi:hypothetical protein
LAMPLRHRLCSPAAGPYRRRQQIPLPRSDSSVVAPRLL